MMPRPQTASNGDKNTPEAPMDQGGPVQGAPHQPDRHAMNGYPSPGMDYPGYHGYGYKQHYPYYPSYPTQQGTQTLFCAMT